MKNFKRLFILVFIAVFAIVLIGCNKKPSADETKLNEMADRVYLGQTDEINNDLKLPKYAFGDKEFAITWESSDTSVIEVKEYETEDKELYYHGSVSMANEVKNVILTATIKYKDLSTTRKFEITVLADEYVGYENIAAVKAKEDKTKDVSKVKFSGTVSFTTNSGFGVSDGSASIYCYQSGHGRTVGEKVEVRGVWTYYNNMVQIASGCVVKSLGMDSTFSIANLAETKTITEIAALEAKTVDPENCTRIFKTTFVAKANASGDYNKYKLVDPTDASKFVDVSKYNDADTITYVGELVEAGKFYEGIVIIYCSRSAGNGGLWDVLLVPSTVKEVEVKLSDSQIVSGILSDLNAAFNGKKVKENLTLPTTHTSGATISWVSNNESVISSTGVYTAPSANTEVKLTATVKLNNETQTVEVTVVAAGEVKTVASLVTNPQVGVAYKLGIDQKELGQILFANGAMSGYYGATITEHADAIDVYLEAVEGGYYVYTMVSGAKKYIAAEVNVTPDKTHINFKYLDSTNVAWVYNAEYNTITCTVSEKEVFIGTKGSYNTIGGYELSTIANGYPVHFYEEVEDKAYTSAPEVGTAYKLGIDQQTLEQMLYFTGTMSGYYGATVETYAEGIDVFFEANGEGYNLYFMLEGAKKYITAVVSEKDGKTYKNFTIADAADNVWKFNSEYSTVVTTVNGLELFMGTRGSYNTVSVYETKEIADDYPVHFYTKDVNGGTVKPEPEPDPEPSVNEYVKEIEVGKAYKFFINQEGLGKVLYFTGAMDGYYGATTEVFAEGVDVFFEVNGSGYSLYFMLDGAKKYITAVVSGTHKNFTIADSPSTVWTFDTTNYTLTCDLEGTTCYMGTYGTYKTFSVSSIDKLATSYPSRFVLAEGGEVTPDPKPEPDPEPSVNEYVKEIEVGKAYKFFINQEGLGKVLYFTGAMDGYYGATTEVFAEGVDVFFEVNGNGYSLYFMLDGAKKYITAVVSGTHKNFTIADKASTVWTFDATNYTLTCDLEGTTCYMGTYGTYKTFSVSSIDKLATSYPARFVLAEGGEVTPDPKPEPDPTPEVIDATVTEILAAAKDLADGSVLEAKYTAKGTVTEVTDAYSEQFKNITFKLTDGTSTILCYRVKGDEATNVKVGDKITLTGEIKNYGGTIEFVNATIISRVSGSVTPDPEPSNADAEIVFDVKEKMTEYSVDKQVWKNGEFVVTNNKHESTQDVKDYVNPARFYANTNLVFEFDKEFKTIVLYTKERCYTGDEEIAGATLTVVDGVMTLVLDTPATSFTIEKLVSQIRVVKAQLFVGEASVEPEPTPDPEPTPEVIDATVTEILAAAKDLADGSVLEAKYTAKGKVTEVTDAYSDQFKNVSFQLSDGTNTILCYRVKGDEAANVKVGDTITLTGEIKNYGGTIEFVNATIIAREAGAENPEPTPDVTPSAASINLTDKNNRTEFSAEKQVWVENGITVTNNKNNSKTDVADYAQARFYVGSEVIIEYTSEITKIVIDTADGKCYKADNIIEGATLTVESGVMTLVLTTPAKSFKIAEIVTQIRAEKIDVYTENEGTVTPTPDPKPEPDPTPDPEPSTDPFVKEIEVGKAYKFFINQEGLGKVLYFKGVMSGYYGATTENKEEGVDVFFEVNGSGYSLYFMLDGAKKYITAVVSGTHKNFTIADKASTVWTFDTTNYTLTCDLEGTTCYMGTYGTYNTFSVSSIDKLATSYPSRFVLAEGGSVTPDPKPEPDPEPSTDPFAKEIALNAIYKFFINQEGLGKVLYFKGVMSGYYGATTENKEEGVDVFFEVNGNGYSLCFMQNGVKKYITAVVSGTHKNFTIADSPSTVWMFDATNYTLTCDLGGTTCYMGTYGTYNTFSVSTIDKIGTSYPARFELIEVIDVPEQPEQPEEPEIEIPENGINWPIENEIPGFVVEYITKDSTIAEVLKMAEKLEDGENLDYAYRVTGIVSEVTDAYNATYKNVSFILKDGSESVICYRVAGDEAANVKAGDTITLIGLMKNYKGTLEFVNGIITERIPVAPAPGTGAEESESLDIFANTGVLAADSKSISWTGTNFVFLNEKATSSSNIRVSDTDHFRVYKSNVSTISALNDVKITKIVITCTNATQVGYLTKSTIVGDVTVLTNGLEVIFTAAAGGIDALQITASNNQWRLNKIVVSYTKPQPAEPVLAGTADLGAIVTPNAFGDSSYTKTYTSPNGWVSKNSAIQTGGTKDMNPTFMVIGSDDTCKAVCLNGKTTAAGSLTSPELEGGISILKFKWAKMFTDTAIKFTVTITDLSTNVQYTKVIEWAGGKNENQKVANEVEFKLDTPINGKFTIKFENNCPSGLASNKDRASIFDIEWYK